MPGIALTCDAEIAVIGKAGARTIKAADFFQGALTTALEPDEIITEIHLPAWPAGRRWGFQEFARRRGDFAMAGVALFYDIDGGKAAQRPCRRDRRRRSAAAAAEGRSRAQRPAPSTRRRSRKVGEAASADGRAAGRHPRQRAPIAARSPARWSSARCKAAAARVSRRMTSDRFEVNGKAGQRRCRAAPDARRLPAPSSCGSPAPMSAASTASAAPARCWSTARRCAPA